MDQILNQALALALCLVFASVIYSDIRFRRISNTQNLVLTLLLLGLCYGLDLKPYFIHSLVSLALGALLFYTGVIGGGDVKLNAALFLVLPLDLIVPYLFFVSLCGAVLAILLLLKAKISKDKRALKRGVPYGVAIIFGFLLSITTKFF